MKLRLYEDTPAFRATAVRLWLLTLFLAGVVWCKRNFDAKRPALLLPWVFLTAGIMIYGAWTLAYIWRPRPDTPK